MLGERDGSPRKALIKGAVGFVKCMAATNDIALEVFQDPAQSDEEVYGLTQKRVKELANIEWFS